MKYNVPQRVIRDIIKTAEKHDIEKVILFGSRARGKREAISIWQYRVGISTDFIGV